MAALQTRRHPRQKVTSSRPLSRIRAQRLASYVRLHPIQAVFPHLDYMAESLHQLACQRIVAFPAFPSNRPPSRAPALLLHHTPTGLTDTPNSMAFTPSRHPVKQADLQLPTHANVTVALAYLFALTSFSLLQLDRTRKGLAASPFCIASDMSFSCFLSYVHESRSVPSPMTVCNAKPSPSVCSTDQAPTLPLCVLPDSFVPPDGRPPRLLSRLHQPRSLSLSHAKVGCQQFLYVPHARNGGAS